MLLLLKSRFLKASKIHKIRFKLLESKNRALKK